MSEYHIFHRPHLRFVQRLVNINMHGCMHTATYPHDFIWIRSNLHHFRKVTITKRTCSWAVQKGKICVEVLSESECAIPAKIKLHEIPYNAVRQQWMHTYARSAFGPSHVDEMKGEHHDVYLQQ